jgi:hypothetical protein
MTTQAFTRNYTDHSNPHGNQFEFFCDKCGNGFRSSFDTSKTGIATSILDAAGALFGGEVQRAAWGADRMSDTFRGPAWDAAFKRAMDECMPRFRQCRVCGRWVCPEVCWNETASLCKECAPDLAERTPAINAQVAVEQAWQQARSVDRPGGTEAQQSFCVQCGGRLAAGSRFCPHCGHPVADAPPAAGGQ